MEVPTYLGLKGGALSLAQVLVIGLPSFVIFGYNQAGLGNLLSLEVFAKHFEVISTIDKVGAAKDHAKTLQGLVVSTFSLGALVGALFCNFMGNKLSRKAMIIIGTFFAFVGQILECTSYKLGQFIVGRVLIGIGVGIFNITVPIWQSECSNPKNRGKHVAMDGAFISLGYLLTNWICLGFYIHQQEKEIAWRLPIAIGCIIMLPLGSIFLFPESPRWLVINDREEEAKVVIACFKELSPDSEVVAAEVEMMKAGYLSSLHNKPKFSELFHMGPEMIGFRAMCCICLQMLQQMCGGNLISVYSTTLYQENLGMSGTLSRILSSCTLTFKFCCGGIVFLTIDRFGRRPLLLISGVGVTLCMMFLGVCTSQKEHHSANIASVFFIFIFNMFYAVGFLGLNWLYVVEISPSRFRNQISAIASANNWIWNFVVTMITPIAIQTIDYKYYLIYFSIGITIPFMVFFFFPETSNVDLEAIDFFYSNASSPFTVVATAKNERSVLLANRGDLDDKAEKAVVEQKEIEE